MKVLFIQSDKPSYRQCAMTDIRKEVFRFHGYEVVTKTIDSCRYDGQKYDNIWLDEFVKLDDKGEDK